MSDVTWLPENGFYEQRSGQGEDEWADQAQFDAIDCPSVDPQTTATPVSWDALTAPLPGQNAKPTPAPPKFG